jgi:hypothetical protein
LSRFQKNALLIIILLAAIAYPPLYYSIQNAIQKESLPKSYNAPAFIPKLALGSWNFSSVKGSQIHGSAIRNLVSYEFLNLSKAVYFGKSEALDKDSLSILDIELGGDFSMERNQLVFIPRVDFRKSFKSYTGSRIEINWEEVGGSPSIIAKAYVDLVTEKIRINRFLLSPPEIHALALDLNPDILSYSEYTRYKSIFEENMPDSEQLTALNFLRSARPRVSFIQYEVLSHSLEANGIVKAKEIWKDWTESKVSSSPFTHLLAFEIANQYLEMKEYDLALEFFQISRKERENFGNVYDPGYAHALSQIAQILLRGGKNEEALFYFTSAKEMYRTLDLTHQSNYVQNQLQYSLLLAILGQREVALNAFFEIESLAPNLNPFEKAIFYYNFARLEYSMHAYESAIDYAQKSKQTLYKLNLTNHDLNFENLILLGAAQFHLQKFHLAQSLWEEVAQARLMIPIEETVYYRNSLLNLAYLYQTKGSTQEAESYYKLYTRITPYSAILPLETKPNLQVSSFVLPFQFDLPLLDEFSNFEERVIKAYTGRYIFTGQDEEIRARTYQDRLEDTNEFLRDLIQTDFFGTPALAQLKNTLFPKSQNYEKGENIVFIDIGPALNNLEAPGITSQSVAYHFPRMMVILWELPSEVDLFLKKVPTEKKEALYSFSNIRILSADGVGVFSESYYDTNRWLFRNRNIPKLDGKTIIIRAANSIDIYETFSKIQPHFKDVAKSLKSNPVLYFFNRSILLKPKGEEKFTLIGYQSVRGFHHNSQSLDRNGEPPYTLAKYTLSE